MSSFIKNIKKLKIPNLLHKIIKIYAEMVEWFKAHAWKACEVKSLRRFESCSLRQNDNKQFKKLHNTIYKQIFALKILIINFRG